MKPDRVGGDMDWHEICERFPQTWLIVEATEAHSEEGQRILEQLVVVESLPDSTTAMRHYARLHRETPDRELYVLHTSRDKLDISERRWLGIRGIV
jgi:hypothetical protein